MICNPKDISPRNIYSHVKKTLENHYFLSLNTGKECKKFLELLQKSERCLNEQKRNFIYEKLSQLTINLWGLMLKEALDALDSADDYLHTDTIKGISRLKQYLGKFKEFEILLYGSDKWYRDTIDHQLWFYFVAEYLFSKYHIMEELLERKEWYCEPSQEIIKVNEETSREKAKYAFLCVIALCHDLGKPLQKIDAINDVIRSMLKEYKFLHFSPFKVEFPLTYETMLNFLVERLGQIAIPDRFNNYSTKQDQLIIRKINDHYHIKMKEYMMNQPHMQATFSTALAELNHGMLSCLLLMESFRRFKGGDPYQNWKKELQICGQDEKWILKSYMTAQSILKSIAYHSINSIKITDIDLPYFWVCLVDDLIEWYRPTRAGKDFISFGLCKVRINKFSLDRIHVCYFFDNKIAKKDDAIHFFIDKIEKYYNILELELEFTIDVEYDDYLMKFCYKKKDKETPDRSFCLKSNKSEKPKFYENKDLEKWLMDYETEFFKEIKSFFNPEITKQNL